ncbi:uncharacterized protein CIMG_10489 [Coccidioides immitis RS]|uniref:Protein kinase domain-containing protein n=1 Tax=Coccidioides immitis (strain RS) TaxID=246410 RepID=A0A0D8JVQ7_COCIM|nr:uncharacterized protein CIMG_10489 [Coccidioides immitis RS]KJF60363.1 hypothetical protein CIMG_10489 [Coccidioides immitis RS]
MALSAIDFEDLQRRLREAEGRAEKAEEEKRKAEEEKQKAEEEKQKAEEEKQKAQEEKQKAEEEKQKAEEEKQKAQEEKQKAEEERDQTKTTFQEYLDLCHIHLSKSLLVQLDGSLSTKGTVTSPKGRYYPKRLVPWEGFEEGQRRRFDEVYGVFHSQSGSPKLFPSRRTLEELGQMLCDRVFASEDDLRPHQQLSVETPISSIIAALSNVEGAPERFGLGRGVKFENHPNTLDEEAEEVQQRLQAYELSTTEAKTSRPVAADRICVYKDMEDKNTLSYLIEYKAPHKLPGTDVEMGLRPMDLEREVVREYRIPRDKKRRKQYDADRKVGSVVTQVFDYMIKSGLEYSYLSTGKAFIFLRIEEADPTTMFYHLIMPDEEQLTAKDLKTNAFHTAVGQVLSFSLLAFTSERRGQDWRRKWRRELPKWPLGGEAILPETPDNAKRPKTPPTSEFKGKPPNVVRSFNLRARPTGRSRCNENETLAYTHSDDDSSSETESGDKETPARSNRTAPMLVEASTNSPTSSRTRNQTRKYCTQACLLGLVRRTALDEDCPNVSAHRAGGHGRQHRITVKTFRRLVQAQLDRTLDQDCDPLWKQGARGNLFRITLASHGYTFVGKGTISVYVPDLQHEGLMYQQLERLQGRVVPVYLGNIWLVEPWLDIGVEIVHMLLMSWGGELAVPSDVPDLDGEIDRSLEEICREGVDHSDVREPNILWNRERRRVMLIDFERSRLLAPNRRPPLQGLSPNKKRQQPFGDGKIRRQRQRSMEGKYQRG